MTVGETNARPVSVDFNSHAHVERDIITALAFVCLDISTHTLTWSVTIPHNTGDDTKFISTHTLTWSVTVLTLSQVRVTVGISTHTLTWSVTRVLEFNSKRYRISTHTLTWSVTNVV